jgi:hypothetical protein
VPKSDRSDKTARLADSVAIVYKQSKKQKRVYVVLDDLVVRRSFWVCFSGREDGIPVDCRSGKQRRRRAVKASRVERPTHGCRLDR